MQQSVDHQSPLWTALDIGISFTRYDTGDKADLRVKEAFFRAYEKLPDLGMRLEFVDGIHGMHDNEGTLEVYSGCALRKIFQAAILIAWYEACEAKIEYYVECAESHGSYLLSN